MIRWTVAAVLLAATFTSISVFASQHEENYALWCRGPLAIVAPASAYRLEFTFRKNPLAAGPTGKKLQPGTCAWVDRPLSASEPTRLFSPEVDYSLAGGSATSMFQIQTLFQRDLAVLTQSLMTPKYRVKMMVHSHLGVVLAPASDPGARQLDAFPF